MKTILFRVDAGGKIGLGHFYRSLSLATTLKKAGWEVVFVHLKSTFWENQKNFPFKHFIIESNESSYAIQLLNQFDCKFFYVDGIIDFSIKFIDEVKKNAKVIFYQNLTDCKIYSDVYIIPSIHQDNNFYKDFSSNTKIFKGLSYFIFNQSILSFKKKAFPEKINKIAVISGGSDPKNVLLTVSELIKFEDFKSIEFIFFYGNDYLHKEKIPENLNQKFKLFDWNEIYSSDLVISSFGVSTYELLLLNIQVLSIGFQESNANASNYLANATKSFSHIGLIDDITEELINQNLETIISNTSLRKKYYQNMNNLLDFNGSERILKILEDEL